MRRSVFSAVLLCGFSVLQAVEPPAPAPQSAAGVGVIEGTVTDPAGLAIPGAVVTISHRLTAYKGTTTTGVDGTFRLNNIPPNPYHVEVTAPGFATAHQDVELRSSVPLALKFSLAVATAETSVTVEGNAPQLENVPYSHNDIDGAAFSKLPASGPASGLSDILAMSTPGVVADSNGFFHPLGDHAQTTFSVDGQPISDQQSKQFSTQLPPNAIQSMEVITGAVPAEFGDKTSLVISAATRSGLGQKPHGSLATSYGSFGTVSEEASIGFGNSKYGNFLAANGLRSGRFLDTPEFRPFHATGNNYSFFDRFDYQPGGGRDSLHLNLFHARNWFQIPDTFQQLWSGQDQRQKVLTFSVAPAYQHTFSPTTLLTISPFWRQDQVNYFPSRNPFADTPVTVGQGRKLANWGTRADLGYVKGIHNVKAGVQLMQTRLAEGFQLGLTVPASDLGLGLAPYDLTEGGRLLGFSGRANINQYAAYVQDAITFGSLTVNAGLRFDDYRGLSTGTAVQPRIGLSYQFKPIHAVLRAAYTRSLETPYNENLILSSSTGAGGLGQNVFGAFAAKPIQPGRRNQFNTGLQKTLGKWVMLDADYFWKFTDNAFDFAALLNTPIAFPISWRESKIDGLSVRVSTLNIHGFQAYTTLGHTRARFFGPSNGGLIFNSPLDTSVFRIDHDQAFQQTTNLRYQRPDNGPWMSFTWRYDSGEVAGAVGDLGDALALSAPEQAAIGFYCGGQQATLSTPITSCSGAFGATRLNIPAPGTLDPDHNPSRVAPRHLFDLGVGTDNLFHTEHLRVTAKFLVTNLANTIALYNFRSTFSGTHFVSPRAYTAQIAMVF